MSVRSALKRMLGVRTWNSDEDQKRFIPDARTIFDVGANLGQTAKTYRNLFPDADIWSFEPFPSTFANLRNALPSDRFHPVPKALSDAIGTATLQLGHQPTTHSFLVRNESTGQSVEVQTDTIDHFCQENNVSSIDILKIDVEGAESKVLRGANRMLREQAVRSIFMEVFFEPVYEGMSLMWDLHALLLPYGFQLRGLYSLDASENDRLRYGNALYLRPADFERVQAQRR